MATAVDDVSENFDDLGLNYGKKKKKSGKVVEEVVEDEPKQEDGQSDEEDDAKGEEETTTVRRHVSDTIPWAGSDRDYTYEELLHRVFALLEEKNPELVGGKKFQLRPPQVVREGTKKTVFVNFRDVCKSMMRNKEHVQQFFAAELGTDCNIDGSERLVIKGKFYPKHIESLIKKYMTEFVQCPLCRGYDTVLVRDSVTRLYFLECNRCNAKKSVHQVKAGFHATTKADRKAAKK